MEAATVMGTPTAGRPSKAMYWTGWALAIIPLFMMTMGGIMAITHNAKSMQGMAHYGYPASAVVWVGVAALACVVLYVIPHTAVLGAILATGYLGGAVSTHVRAGEPFWLAILCATLLWLGLWLREGRLRALTPLRR